MFAQSRVPLRQVCDCGDHAEMRGYAEVNVPTIVDPSLSLEQIAIGQMRNNFFQLDRGRRAHSQRLEDPLLEEVTITQAAGVLNQHAQQKVALVTVLPARAGSEVERPLARSLIKLVC